MGKKTNIDVTASINRITGKKDQFQQIVRETEAFFDMVESNPMEVKVDNVKGAINNLQQVRAEYDKIHNDINSDHGQIEFADILYTVLDKAEDKFSEIGVMFKNVNTNTKKYVTGLSNITQYLSDSNFGIKFMDIGAQFGNLQTQAEELFSTLKSMGTVQFGRFDLDFASMDADQLRECLSVLNSMRDVVNQMTDIDPNMSRGDFVGQLNSRDLSDAVGQAENYLDDLRRLRLDTTEELRKRKEIIYEIEDGYTWEDYEHEEVKQKIHNDEAYEDAIESIQRYIDKRRAAIEELRAHEYDLFAADGIYEYESMANAEIERLQSLMKELQDLRGDKINDTPVVGDFSGVVQQLEAIKNAVVEIKDAFKPLTDALANEDSALSKMVQSNVTDLELLNSKVEETFRNIETLSNKQFNMTNVISNGNNTQNDIEQIRQFRQEAKEVYKQVEELYTESIATASKIKGTPGGLDAFLDFSNTMSEFDMTDLARRIKSRSAASLGIVIDELNEWKKVLLQFNNLRNNVEAGSFNVSKYSDTSSRVKIGSKTTDKEEKTIADSNTVDDDILNKIKSLSEQVETELASIRSKMVETFNFDTIDPKIENIKTITDNIYQQFVELQTKINALDLNLNIPVVTAIETKSESDVINDTGDAMKNEGDAAEDAVPKKNAFTEANKRAADSAEKTEDATKGAAEGVVEESKAVQQAAQNLAKVNSAIDNTTQSVKLKGLSQEDFEEYASRIAADKGLTMGQVSVTMGQNDNMRVATVQMLNEELAQSVTYTYQLVQLEDEVTEAYLTGYRAVGNTNKSLKIAAAAQKKADAERLKAAKEQAKNNQWLIRQQSKLDTQERKYKSSNKPIDGSTSLMSTETSLADDADKTIDSLAKHIRERISSTMGGALTDELREEILNDLRILQNEIAVKQNEVYSATNMKASNVETNKKAYKEYLNAFEANAKKANVFNQIEESIQALRDELGLVSDSASMDKFIDNLKVARNKLQAEKAKYAQESQENQQNEEVYNTVIKAQEKLYKLKKQMVGLDLESSEGQETMRKLTEAQNEYNEALSKTNRQLLTIGQIQSIEDLGKQQKTELNTKQQEYKSKVSVEQEAKDLKYVLSLYKEYTDAEQSLKKMQSDPTGAVHDEKMVAALADVKKAKEALLSLGIDVNNISESELLTEKQKAELLEAQAKHRKQIRDIENAASDKATTKQNKQSQNYGKTIFNREDRWHDKIGANKIYLSESGLSEDFKRQLDEYEEAYQKLKKLREEFENNPNAANNSGLKKQFQDATLECERLRTGVMAVFKESQKFDKLSDGALIGSQAFKADELVDLKSAMIEFAAEVTNGQFKFEGFNEAGTKMYGVLDDGTGALQKVTIALRDGTNSLYAYKDGTKQVSNSWQKLGSDLKSGIKNIINQYVGFHEAIQAVRQGLTYVKEIDLAMTELKKVTDETDATYKNFLKTASSTASVIGSTVSDFTDATAAFARLGYSIDESSKMAETAIVYKNVADGLDTVEESTDSIISTMMAYGIAADDTMSIIDRFNAVGNNFAITSAGIGEAMQRSASALKEGGNTIDESIGLITGANAVIQDPLQVGTALKTLSLRIRGVKTELEEAGLETEGMAETTSQLQAKLKALTHEKVDIMLNED